MVSLLFSLLPDIDSFVGIIKRDFGRYHNNITHGLFFGVLLTFPFSLWLNWKTQRSWIYWFAYALPPYFLHILMDSLTWGRGVMALWPFSSRRYRIPIRLFYGFHWSEGWLSRRHLWTFLSELLLISTVSLRIRYLIRNKSRCESV